MSAQLKARILLVDDELDNLELLAYVLEKENFEVVTANSGQVGLAKARTLCPDLILLDLLLSDLDGFSVCEHLRKHPRTHKIPVFILTAMGGELSRIVSLYSGADEYLVKTMKPMEIVARAKRFLQARLPNANGVIGKSEATREVSVRPLIWPETNTDVR